MIYGGNLPFELLSGLISVTALGTVALLVVVLVRLMLAATRTLNAITSERLLRTDLLLADDDDDDPEELSARP